MKSVFVKTPLAVLVLGAFAGASLPAQAFPAPDPGVASGAPARVKKVWCGPYGCGWGGGGYGGGYGWRPHPRPWGYGGGYGWRPRPWGGGGGYRPWGGPGWGGPGWGPRW